MTWYHLPDKAETLLLPMGEGSRIPLDNPEWRAYLQQEMEITNTHWDLKLPLWSQQHQKLWFSWLMLNPYDNELQFSGDAARLKMLASHKFSPMSFTTPFRVLLTVGDTPLSGAIRYREQLQQQGQFSSLSDKMAKTQDGNKLIGASHLYLWGNGLLAAENVRDWPGLLHWLTSEAGTTLRQGLAQDVVAEIQQTGSRKPEKWQQIRLIEALNQAITSQVKSKITDAVGADLAPQQQQAAATRNWTQQHLAQWLIPPGARVCHSPWFLGAWWPESQPAQFFQPTKLKPRYKTVVFDPRYRVPLYQAVFHDSVIATHHWTYDNLKFPEVKRTRDLLSLLYNTPPLFNLSRTSLVQRLPEIVKMDRLFRPMHEILWDKALVDFRWLDESGWVQQTRFSDGSQLSANFSDVVRAGIQPYELVMHRPNGEVKRFSL